ncbi:MAG: SIR2 family protein [Xanthobacteraceae bacterium]
MAEATHDPHQFLNQFRQTLATSKLAIGFLLGAGCPCAIKNSEGEPTIPDVVGLTKKVSEKVSKSEEHKACFETLLNVLLEDGEASPNIETILGRIRALNDVAGKGKVRGLSSDDLAELDRTICGAITEIVDCEASADETPYRSLAKYIQDRRGFPTEAFTTNYDLLLENALEAQRMPYFDGFAGGVRPFFDQTAIDDDKIPERWCRLWKIHGSINWRSNRKSIVRSKDKNDGEEQLIHPSHRKYDEKRRMPYLVMMDRLRDFIRNQHHRERLPVALIVVGYSFSDKHINEALAENLQANPSAVCYALQYDVLDRYPKAKELATEVAT